MSKISTIKLKSQKQFELIDITSEVTAVVESESWTDGVVSVFTPHTTASIKINHNEPLLMQDLMKMIYRLVPLDMNYSHDLFEIRTGIEAGERTNGHAHVKAFLLGSSETIPFQNKRLMLGKKQSIFFVELDGARERQVLVRVAGS